MSRFLGFGLEDDRAHRIDDHFEEGDVQGPEDQGQAEEERDQREAGDRHMDRKDVGHRLAQIVVDPPPEAHRPDDRGEIVVEQHQRGGLPRDVGAAPAHRDADMGGLQRRRVVDAVAGHRDDLAIGLQRLDDAKLLFGQRAGEDGGGAGALRSSASVIGSRSAPVTIRWRRSRPAPQWRARSADNRR